MSILAPWNEPYSPQDERQAVAEFNDAKALLRDYGAAYIAARTMFRKLTELHPEDKQLAGYLADVLDSLATINETDAFCKAADVFTDGYGAKGLPLSPEWRKQIEEAGTC